MSGLLRRLVWGVWAVCALGISAGAQTVEEDGWVEAASQEALARVTPGVVSVEGIGGLEEGFEAPQSEEEAQGGVLVRRGFKLARGPSTGVVVREDGLIVTTAFALSLEPVHVFVTLSDGRCYVAEVLGRDEVRQLVLLRAELGEGETLPVPAAQARPAQVGQFALAVGRGLGLEGPTMSRGIVSALNRAGGVALQSSAAISPVNYGGPLVGIDGGVLGVLVPLQGATVESYDSGIGFAVPWADVQRVVPRLEAGEVLRPGVLGVVPSADDPDDLDRGVRIEQVSPGSPADVAGVRAGWEVLRVGDARVRLGWELRRALSAYYAGDQLELVCRRADGTEVRLGVRLGEQPSQ